MSNNKDTRTQNNRICKRHEPLQLISGRSVAGNTDLKKERRGRYVIE